MNTRALNALAGVIAAAQKLDRTPMGIAIAIESAGMLLSPEVAAELTRARGAAGIAVHRINANSWKCEADALTAIGIRNEVEVIHRGPIEDPHDSPLHHPYTTARLREDEGANDGR